MVIGIASTKRLQEFTFTITNHDQSRLQTVQSDTAPAVHRDHLPVM
jgi:hypothetical protein